MTTRIMHCLDEGCKIVCNVLTRTRHAHQLSSMKHFFRVKVPMMTAQRNPYVKKQLNASKRVDVVWDTYVVWSQPGQRNTTRGSRRNKLPNNWADFLHDSGNKWLIPLRGH